MTEITQPWQGAEPHSEPADPQPETTSEAEPSAILRIWDRLRRLGLADSTLRLATAVITLTLVLVVVGIMDAFYLPDLGGNAPGGVLAEGLPTPTPTLSPPVFAAGGSFSQGIPRRADLHTVLPMRNERFEVVQYTVESGDSIFSIAEKFNLKPESILWGNRYSLGEDPHFIIPGQTLNILPIDGVYHQWSAGEGLNGVAEFYGVAPEDIVNWPGNDLDIQTVGDFANPQIPPDTMLVVPGGEGVFTDWRTPRISRDAPATAKNLGPGACTSAYNGVTGTLSFMWPSSERYLSGFDYAPETNHFGIDIAGRLGNPIYAADHGVVVYAGWNDYGYGEMVVVDHGSGWQTLYAHLSVVNVVCGQEVYQGDTIGSMGSTGMSTGPHLHFEMRSEDYGRVNPWDFLN